MRGAGFHESLKRISSSWRNILNIFPDARTKRFFLRNTNVGKFDFTSILLGESEARSILCRPEINALLNNLVQEKNAEENLERNKTLAPRVWRERKEWAEKEETALEAMRKEGPTKAAKRTKTRKEKAGAAASRKLPCLCLK